MSVMGSGSRVTAAVSRWIDEVAEAVLAGIGHFRAPARVLLTEQTGGTFISEKLQPAPAGDSPGPSFRLGPDALADADLADAKAVVEDARVEVLLAPSRFLFRPLELPSRAGEFLDGIVHAQIDRLTPWSAANALYGWSPPVETSSGRMVITVAATGRNLVAPVLDALSGLGAASISLGVRPPEPGGDPILVSDRTTKASRDIHRARGILLSVLLGLCALAAVSVLAQIIVGSDLSARQAGIAERIEAIRSSLQARRDPASEPVAAMQRRKREAPASVLVLEAISATLPDHTYLTELRIQDGKVQIIGMTKDAPSLIERLERSRQFSAASFLAPTTRSLAKPGDTFHIEARIEPPGAAQP